MACQEAYLPTLCLPAIWLHWEGHAASPCLYACLPYDSDLDRLELRPASGMAATMAQANCWKELPLWPSYFWKARRT